MTRDDLATLLRLAIPDDEAARDTLGIELFRRGHVRPELALSWTALRLLWHGLADNEQGILAMICAGKQPVLIERDDTPQRGGLTPWRAVVELDGVPIQGAGTPWWQITDVGRLLNAGLLEAELTGDDEPDRLVPIEEPRPTALGRAVAKAGSKDTGHALVASTTVQLAHDAETDNTVSWDWLLRAAGGVEQAVAAVGAAAPTPPVRNCTHSITTSPIGHLVRASCNACGATGTAETATAAEVVLRARGLRRWPCTHDDAAPYGVGPNDVAVMVEARCPHCEAVGWGGTDAEALQDMTERPEQRALGCQRQPDYRDAGAFTHATCRACSATGVGTTEAEAHADIEHHNNEGTP